MVAGIHGPYGGIRNGSPGRVGDLSGYGRAKILRKQSDRQ
jgi:hypothetical protein